MPGGTVRTRRPAEAAGRWRRLLDTSSSCSASGAAGVRCHLRFLRLHARLFTGPAIERLRAEADIEDIVTTDTVPIPTDKRLPNMTILSIALLLAEAIRCTHLGKSVSCLFDVTE